MEQLDQMAAVLQAMPGLSNAAEELHNAKEELKLSLINVISSSHPEHVFKVKKEEIQSCTNFLRYFIETNGKIFTTNYDLLLYWVINRGLGENEKLRDGFSKYVINPEEVYREKATPKTSELIWTSKNRQNVFNLHGGLHIFDDKGKITKETYDNHTGDFLLANINKRMQKGHYPIFVTDGDGNKKLEHIRRNSYLRNAYESLSEIKGSLIVFGFSFSENDDHIIEAINAATRHTPEIKIRDALLSVNIGVFNEADREHIEKISNKFALVVNTFDSKTAGIWR